MQSMDFGLRFAIGWHAEHETIPRHPDPGLALGPEKNHAETHHVVSPPTPPPARDDRMLSRYINIYIVNWFTLRTFNFLIFVVVVENRGFRVVSGTPTLARPNLVVPLHLLIHIVQIHYGDESAGNNDVWKS